MGYDHSDDGIPSWVPDYRDDLGPSPLFQLRNPWKWAYNACGAHKSRIARVERSQLLLQDSKTHQIAQIPEMGLFDDGELPNLTDIQSWAGETPSTTCLPRGETVDNALRTTILADMDPVREARGNLEEWDLLRSETIPLAASRMQRKDDMMYALDRACKPRLCWTVAGLVGLVSIEAKVGDETYYRLAARCHMSYGRHPRMSSCFLGKRIFVVSWMANYSRTLRSRSER